MKICEMLRNNEPQTDPVTLMHKNNADFQQVGHYNTRFLKSFKWNTFFLFHTTHNKVILTIAQHQIVIKMQNAKKNLASFLQQLAMFIMKIGLKLMLSHTLLLKTLRDEI